MEILISQSLEAVAFAHYQEFHDLDHTDPDWSIWYAQWLLHESEIADILTPYFGVPQLSALLHKLDGRYKHTYGSYAWCSMFAREIASIIKE